MHLLAGFALALVTLAFVQSRPALPQLDGATVARANINDLVALGNQFGLNNLDGVLALFPQFAGLAQQLTGIAHQVANTLSPSQLYTLEQQALQAAQSVISGDVPLQTAVNQLFAQVQQALGQDSSILSNVQPVVQQLLAAVGPLLALLPSNLGQRSAPVARANINDLLALANQGLVQQFSGVAHQVINALTPSQLENLEQQLLTAVQSVLSGGVPLQDAVNQVLAQLQQALGSDSAILSNVQPVVQQFVSVVGPLLSLFSSNLVG
jgi:molybdopterin converting factor small subunit